MGNFKLVRIGFDTIIVAFRATLPVGLREVLRAAKASARDRRSDEPIELGPGEVQGNVLAHGVQGGYDVVFSTGELGELWYFKTEQKGDKWPLRMKVRAASLLVHGYPAAVEFALSRLKEFGICVEDAHLSEAHICIDVITDAAFRLDENRLVRPGRSKVRPYDIFDRKHPLVDPDIPWDAQRVLQGRRLQSVTVGTARSGSQSIIYDKRAEALAKRNSLIFEAYGLDKQDTSSGLWRFEARLRGDTLKRHFKVRTFVDLHSSAVKMIDWATKRVRYIVAGQDNLQPTRCVLDPYWITIREATSLLEATQPSKLPPCVAEDILFREKIATLEASGTGAFIARAAMTGEEATFIVEHLSEFVSDIVQWKIQQDPDKVLESVQRAIDRNMVT